MKKKYKKGANVWLSASFHLTEFDCKCISSDCQWTIIDTKHVKKLQKMREQWAAPVKITSGYRCEKHNKMVGGATKSRHIFGDATDIIVVGVKPSKVADDCDRAKFKGLGRYNTFTHVDSRDIKKARWDFRRK